MDKHEHRILFHTLTEYDQKQSTKPHHNKWALAHYAKALENVILRVKLEQPLRDAIITEFTGQLCDKLLKSVGLPKMTVEEAKTGLKVKLPDL